MARGIGCGCLGGQDHTRRCRDSHRRTRPETPRGRSSCTPLSSRNAARIRDQLIDSGCVAPDRRSHCRGRPLGPCRIRPCDGQRHRVRMASCSTLDRVQPQRDPDRWRTTGLRVTHRARTPSGGGPPRHCRRAHTRPAAKGRTESRRWQDCGSGSAPAPVQTLSNVVPPSSVGTFMTRSGGGAAVHAVASATTKWRTAESHRARVARNFHEKLNGTFTAWAARSS
jgi:hypothetical protein